MISDRQIEIAVAASTANGRTNWTAAARALGVTRAWLLDRCGAVETRGAPRSSLTLAEAAEAVRVHGGIRQAARATGWPASTLRDRENARKSAAVTDGKQRNRQGERK